MQELTKQTDRIDLLQNQLNQVHSELMEQKQEVDKKEDESHGSKLSEL